MGRLVVVSNRVGDISNPTQTGGLAVAMAAALRSRGGLWFGWDGKRNEDASGAEPRSTECQGVTCAGVPLSEQDYRQYYIGYSNSVLWPLFHYRTDLIDYRKADYQGYERVNAQLARRLQPLLRDDDIIWIHDYHLIPFAKCLRAAGCRHAIGFFLHIPFPPPEMLTAAPNHAALVDALLDYDLVGFQTQADLSNFHRYIDEQAAGALLPGNMVRAGGRSTRTGNFPISIDVADFRHMAETGHEDVRIDMMRRHILKRKQIIGVDRLDYSKGIPLRFTAVDRLLTQHPELEKAVSMLQIAPPTREGIKAYTEIRSTTEAAAGAINSKYADFNWTPIRFIHRVIERDKLAALFRASQVGLVTPLRDGMNLVAKEYVAAQDPEDPGVLVLSQFAGAAEELVEALIVNPHDVDDIARRLYEALTMPLAERQAIHAALLARLCAYDVSRWASAFLGVLDEAHRSHESRPAALVAYATDRTAAGRNESKTKALGGARPTGYRQPRLATPS